MPNHDQSGMPLFLGWGEHQSFEQITETITAQVQAFLKLDRVLLYRFDADFNGEVIAEACDQERLPSLLGLHFPASDIPPQARSLFQKARQRLIVDVVAKHKIAFTDAGEPQNRLSLHEDARYSPVDPCHLQYLLGLGVMSSITFTILHQGSLWGLLVGHHSQPRHFPEAEIQSGQLLVDQLSVALAQEQLRQQVQQHQQQEALLGQLQQLLGQESLTADYWRKILQVFSQGLGADGCRLYLLPDSLSESPLIHHVGVQPAIAPEAEDVWPVFCDALEPLPGAPTTASLETGHCLMVSRCCQDWSRQPKGQVLASLFEPTSISAILVLPIHGRGQTLGYLSLFRQETSLEMTWAGQHSKDPRNRQPRASFAAWREQYQHARPWACHELDLAQSARLYLYMGLMQHWVDHRVQQRSAHDSMTQLPNWCLFNEQLNLAVLHSLRQGLALAVGVLDISKFKQVNRSHGHTFGNYLLQLIAYRLQSCLENQLQLAPSAHEWMLARWHGDKFAFLLPLQEGREQVENYARTILDCLREPFLLRGQEIFVTGSLGIAIAPYDGNTSDALVQRAEAAMYQSKQQNVDGYQIYTPALTVGDSFFHQRLANDLYRALTQHELLLYFQPQAQTSTGKITGLEVLVRWQHPQLGLVPPNRFIPIAEEAGLIDRLGEWVLRAACLQYRQWRQAGLPPLTLAVNLSASQLENPQLIHRVQEVLEDTGVPPTELELEITEETITRNIQQAVKVLTQLKEIGIRIALDDFGTGYSSLNVLKHFPVDTLKIDKSFVRDCPNSHRDAAIAQTIIALGHGLNLNVLAEGVETPEHLTCLREMGCDFLQGYYLSHPQPAANMFEWLMAQHHRQQVIVAGLAQAPSQDNLLRGSAFTCPYVTTDTPQTIPAQTPGGAGQTTPNSAPANCLATADAEAVTAETVISISSMAIALQPDRLHYQLQREQLIRSITEKIRQSLYIEDILSTTVEEVRHLLDTDRVLLYQFSKNWDGHVVQESVAPQYPSLLGLQLEDHCFAEKYVQLYRQGRIRAITDIAKSDIADCHREMLQSFKIQANLVVPVVYKAQLWGLLIVHHCRSPRPWTQDEVALLGQLAVQVAIAIHQGELYQQLELANRELHALSARDGLTRLANRHRFDQHFAEEWNRLQRSQAPLSLLLCDIDYFKQYNDTYGHLAGDRCLQQVAELLGAIVQRPGDLAARYGGEEFVLLLPETNLQGATIVAERIQTELQALAIPHGGAPLKTLTMSIGVACQVPQVNAPSQDLIKQADKALYEAKVSGRNRFAIS